MGSKEFPNSSCKFLYPNGKGYAAGLLFIPSGSSKGKLFNFVYPSLIISIAEVYVGSAAKTNLSGTPVKGELRAEISEGEDE